MKTSSIETTYIDDFTRARRDEAEWWKLADLSKRLKKRMIGASDGFDVNSPEWDISPHDLRLAVADVHQGPP